MLSAAIGKLVAILIAALTLSVGSWHPPVSGHMSLTEVAGPASLLGSQLFLPGAPARVASYQLRLDGPVKSRVAGLFVDGFGSADVTRSPRCTAADPAAGFDVAISEGGVQLFAGRLSQLAREHGSAPDVLPLSQGRLVPGQVVTVQVSVELDRAADNRYMGCSLAGDMSWYAAQ
ncbi:MAG TPA: hypothetical protein VMU49_04275 [Candidatus Acidoferrales bacterium]|nr:hypothetical protein [Candidatus Acidoferrales bacterium]